MSSEIVIGRGAHTITPPGELVFEIADKLHDYRLATPRYLKLATAKEIALQAKEDHPDAAAWVGIQGNLAAKADHDPVEHAYILVRGSQEPHEVPLRNIGFRPAAQLAAKLFEVLQPKS
ncbi:MAG TPA: hypothetical protein VGP13_03345 [Candidatus Paceibacterota bacterium]|jgi:hypothetical protein|nr:hypothetical protein [Candidatus Paceibacterota bacterium]